MGRTVEFVGLFGLLLRWVERHFFGNISLRVRIGDPESRRLPITGGSSPSSVVGVQRTPFRDELGKRTGTETMEDVKEVQVTGRVFPGPVSQGSRFLSHHSSRGNGVKSPGLLGPR